LGTSFQVGLEFSAKTQQLDAVVSKIQKFERDLGKLKGADPFQGVENSAKGAGRAVEGMGRQAKVATGAVNGLGGAVRGLAGAFALVGAAKFIFAKTAELESQTASLKVLTGELGKAKAIISELQQFANVTPFTSTELVETAKRLKAFGVDTEKLVDTTKRLGDVAGATGADLSGIATAYGQIQAKGRLQGEELLQLQERGINLQDELQKMYGMTGDQFRSALEKGKFSAEAVEVALKNLTSAGGKYANGAISQSETLNGKLSTLQDAFDELARKIGKALSPAMIGLLTTAAAETSKWSAVVGDLGDAWFYASEQIKPFINGLGQVKWYFENLTPPGWAMKLTGGLGGALPGAVGGMAERGRELKGYGGTSRFAGAREAAFERARGITGATAPTAGPPPALLGGTTKPGGGGSRTGSAATGPKLPEYIDKSVLRQWLISQGMGRTSGDFTNAGHRTPNHMLNAMDMGFTSSKYDHNYVQKTIEMERKLRATGAFGNQLFGPERDPRGHKDHLHVPTPGGKVKMNPALASLMGIAGGGQEGQFELAQQLMELEAERAEKLQESLKTGQELSQQFSRELQIRQAATPLEKEILQIKNEHLDNQSKIDELLDEGQKKELGLLNTELERLRVAEAQVKAFYDQADAAGALSVQMKAQGSGAFRTDIDLNPNQSKMQDYLTKLKTELADTESMVLSLAGTIESEIGSAMSNAITGLIQGTMTAQQAFSQMFSAIGKAFIDMATQMIAKALIMKVLGILGGGIGGGLGGGNFSSAFGSSGPSFNPGSFGGGMKLFAEGGFVTSPTNAIIGEAGDSEYVIPSQKMASSMANYSAGKRGAAVLDDTGGAAGSGGGAGGGTFTLETVVINRQEYATIEQVRAMGQAAAKQGADGGHSRVMGDFRNKRSVRSRVGMR
jgi:tape measure domain-containing protein